MNNAQHRLFIVFSAAAPIVALVLGVVLLWDRAVHPIDLILLVVMYVIAIAGVSTGYHRLLTHRSFQTSRPIKVMLIIAGSVAGQGPALIWAAHHRRHHRVADKPTDPHSPYVWQDRTYGTVSGLAHAHMGWLFDHALTSDPIRYCPDLARDGDVRWLSRHFTAIVAAGLLVPGLIALAVTGTAVGFLEGVLWGGLIRFFLVNHVTYAVNSVGHVWGNRRFNVADESRNVFWLAIPSFGEGWHNNHHAFPRSYAHGLRWYEVDLSALLIRALILCHLASEPVRPDRRLMDRKAEALAKTPGGRTADKQVPEPLAQRKDVGSLDLMSVE